MGCGEGHGHLKSGRKKKILNRSNQTENTKW